MTCSKFLNIYHNCQVFCSIPQIPIIYTDDSEDDIETANDKTTSENTERNKSIPTFDLETDSVKDLDTRDLDDEIFDDDDDLPIQIVRGTVV